MSPLGEDSYPWPVVAVALVRTNLPRDAKYRRLLFDRSETIPAYLVEGSKWPAESESRLLLTNSTLDPASRAFEMKQ